MNEPAIYQENLPSTIEDLSRFVLVGREKLVAVKAEIRAIDKVQLAREVRDQKRDEARMLSEALLDAEVRLGEMLKALPKDTTFKGNQFKEVNAQPCDLTTIKPKHEVIAELGFSKDQANRFETLANNKDLVEQAKVEAREKDDIPTRTQVLNLAKARNERNLWESRQADEDYKNLRSFWKSLREIESLNTDRSHLDSLLRAMVPDKEDGDWYKKEFGEEDESLKDEIDRVRKVINKLLKVRDYLLTAYRSGGQDGKI